MMRGKLPNVFAVLAPCAFLLAASPAPPASAQTPARQSQERAAPTPSPETRDVQQSPQTQSGAPDDLSITAHVTARELRFDKVPNPKVEFTGRPRRDTAWESERENLPQQVRPGVTYRDIGITLRITSVFADIDRIVAEALGELPPSDDAQPAQPSPPGQTDTQPARPDDAAPAAQQVSPAPADAQAASRRTPSPPKALANAAKTTRRARAGRVR
jgi:hypothetical protein